MLLFNCHLNPHIWVYKMNPICYPRVPLKPDPDMIIISWLLYDIDRWMAVVKWVPDLNPLPPSFHKRCSRMR